MKSQTKIKIFFLAVLWISITDINSQEKIKPIPKGKEFSYYDGDKQIKIYLQEDLLAELHPHHSLIKSYDARAVPIKKSGIVKIYRVQDSKIKNQVKEGKFTKEIPSSMPISEVFVSENGLLMALPGRLILSFKDEIKEQEIQNFLNKRGLSLIRKQTFLDKTFYVVKYKAGIDCLELANQLRNEPMIQSAEPDWWKEFSLR